MITGANLPIGDPASLFKNPAQAGLDALGVSQGGMGGLSSAMMLADPSFDPAPIFSTMTTASASITAGLTAKVASITTELPLALGAAHQQQATQSVDAILSGNLANIPNQIDNSFPAPNNCPVDYVKDSFKSITESNALVTSSNDGTAALFNNTGSMSTLYTALNAIPGVVVTNGKELLATINSGGAAVTAAVTATVLGSPALLSTLKTSFNGVVSGPIADMTSGFNSLVASSTASINSAIKSINGKNFVGMINSANPCVKAVMGSAIDQTKVDQTALTLSAGMNFKPPAATVVKSSPVSLPGQESVEVASTAAPVDLGPPATVPASQMVSPSPGNPTIELYTKAEYLAFTDQLTAQNSIFQNINRAAATWYKPNIEEWKQTVGYERKKTAAGASESNVIGTSTDPVALSEWADVYALYLPKKNYYNETFPPQARAAKAKLAEMSTEFNQRGKFGKYPYTYQIAQGISIPEDKQYTWLSPTK